MKHPAKPNHLAKTIDHQKFAASSLPTSLMDNIIKLNQLTHEIKVLLIDGLPNEILETLWVGKYDEGNLVISVQSQTAANHLRYQSSNLKLILKEQSLTFSQLNNIDVIVTSPASINSLNGNEQRTTRHIKQAKSAIDKGSDHGLRGLTESTRRTIAYTTEHVISDKRLKACLERLVQS